MGLKTNMSCLRVLGTCLLCLVVGLESKAQTPSVPTPSGVGGNFDFPGLIRETQQSPNVPGYVGLVWWIPTQYWVISAERSGLPEEKASERFAPLKKYTVVVVAVGKIGVGNVNWFSEQEIRENTVLRDGAGDLYRPVDKLSGDAQGLASILKPVFANLLGSMGQNTQMLFFSGSDRMAKPIADPLSQGSFSVVLRSLLAGQDSIFEWRLPLTSISPPRYCPVGKERLQANWQYCPWHGVKLADGIDDPAKIK